MKVYVMTKAKLFCEEVFVDVKGSKKAAEKAFRDKYPNMRYSGVGDSYTSQKEITPDNGALLLFIHEREV